MKKKNSILKITAIAILFLFIFASAVEAIVKFDITSQKDSYSNELNTTTILDESLLNTWEDDFLDESKIDPSPPGSGLSENYIVEDGVVSMKNTCPAWTDPSWTRMKTITLTNNIGQEITNHPLYLTVNYDSDMQSDYDDIRFKHENNPNEWLDYWIENKDISQANVWVIIPSVPTGQSTMYLFYGKASATSHSDFNSVFPNWEKEWTNDEKITNHANNEGTWDPDVCYGNGEFLVTWEEGQAYYLPYTWGFKQEIRASIYDLDGTQLVDDKLVYQDSTLYYRNENPSIAFGNGKYFVAWEHYDTVANPDFTTMDIKARMVQRSGSNLQLGSFIDVSTAIGCQADANVEYDPVNNQFCVIWEDGRAGGTPPDYNIYGKLYTTSGSQVGPEKLICSSSYSETEPWVAFDPINEQYMIVWEEADHPEDGPFDIKMGLFDSSLNLIGSYNIVAEGNDDTDYNYPCVEFCEETERYLVTWNDGDLSDDDFWGYVWGKIYDSSGSVVVDTFQISAGDNIRTDIVPYLTSTFLVSYDDDTIEKIHGKLITSEGEILTSAIQLSSDSALADWVNMAVGDGKVFVSWEDIREGYPFPWTDMPDVYGNIWHLDIPDGTEVAYAIGSEQDLVLSAYVTSIAIELGDLAFWENFNVISSGNIYFDILDGVTGELLLHDVSNGESIASISAPSIRLKGCFSRDNPSSSPLLDLWGVGWFQDQPPNIPNNPSPTDGANNVGINEDLSWDGGDPDPGDTVTYDVYFGIVSPPPQAASGQSELFYDPGTMLYNKTYFWKIDAWDNHGAKATGPIWEFKTIEQPADTTPPEITDVGVTFSNPIDTDSSYGWEEISCNVIDTNSGVKEVYLNLTYPDTSDTSVLMNKNGGTDTYYHNITYSDVGEYSYYIWAIDNLNNQDTSSIQTFKVPPNWDIDMNGHIFLPDIVQVSLKYDQEGPNGWIREDIDNNGEVFLPDLVQVSLYYDEIYPIDGLSPMSSIQAAASTSNLGTTYASVSPSTQTVSNGESFTIDIYVQPGEPINGVALALSYDPNLIQADEVSEGNLFGDYTTFFNPGTIDNNAGTIKNIYGFTVPATNTVTNPGIFCTISFTAQSNTGTSNIHLYDACITNIQAECIPGIVLNDGNVQIDAEPPETVLTNLNDFYNTPPVISGTATDQSYGDIDKIEMRIQRDSDSYYWAGGSWQNANTWFDAATGLSGWNNVPWTASSLPSWQNGITYDLEVRAYDDGGNVDTSPAFDSFSYDTMAPTISNIDIIFSNPIDTDPLYGWEEISCDVIDTISGVKEVYLYLTYPDLTEVNILMSKTVGTDTFYHDTSLSDVGEYSYYISAIDNLNNQDTSSIQTFSVPTNWDVDMDGHIFLPDLVQVSLKYNQEGPNGWIREDIDNNGEVFLPDLVQVSLHYDEIYLIHESSSTSSSQKNTGTSNTGTTQLSVSPSSQTVSEGESFTLDIYVQPGEPINGVALALSYDPNLIQADELTEGNLFEDFTTFFNPGNIDNTAGAINSIYGLTVPATNTVTNPGIFCNISFTAQSNTGTSTIHLFDACITNIQGECISDINLNDGTITVGSGSNHPPEFVNEDPQDDSHDISIDTSSLSIYISDSEGDSFDWTIETSPDIGSASDNNDINGKKSCNIITTLEYSKTYKWYVNATDPSGSGQTTSEVYIFTTESESSNPPDKPTISGPASGKTGESYTYYANANDPDGDQVYYWFDWDDGTNSGWLGPYNSGQTVSKSHVWNTKGSFSIKAKAKDTNSGESEWSNPISISIPKNKKYTNRPFLNFLENHPRLFPILQRLLKLPVFEKLLNPQ